MPSLRTPRMMLAMLVLSLAGCAAGSGQDYAQGHLSATECNDLTALRNHAPPTRQRNSSELAALERAGYQPWLRFDPYYPADLQDAQRRVDRWYVAECPQAVHTN
jgi:hypothetical protein